jgi:uncharacterized membrane protein YfcA
MGIATSSLAVLRLEEDPLVSLLVALGGYGVSQVLLFGVFPPMRLVGAVWLILAVTLVSTTVVAAYRRKAALFWVVVLEGSGLAGVVVGFGFGMYMAFEMPSWLTTLAMLLCFAYTIVGIFMVTAAIRIKKSTDAVLPPNQSLERTREG